MSTGIDLEWKRRARSEEASLLVSAAGAALAGGAAGALIAGTVSHDCRYRGMLFGERSWSFWLWAVEFKNGKT